MSYCSSFLKPVADEQWFLSQVYTFFCNMHVEHFYDTFFFDKFNFFVCTSQFYFGKFSLLTVQTGKILLSITSFVCGWLVKNNKL